MKYIYCISEVSILAHAWTPSACKWTLAEVHFMFTGVDFTFRMQSCEKVSQTSELSHT